MHKRNFMIFGTNKLRKATKLVCCQFYVNERVTR